MPTTIDRNQVKKMMEQEAAAVVEVLDEGQFKKFHLPHAINVPLGDDFESEVQDAVPDKHTSVVVYCMDEDCDASPKAAERMEQLGYDRVYDYESGKVDWKDANLPIET